jgi:hypothetical protein
MEKGTQKRKQWTGLLKRTDAEKKQELPWVKLRMNLEKLAKHGTKLTGREHSHRKAFCECSMLLKAIAMKSF